MEKTIATWVGIILASSGWITFFLHWWKAKRAEPRLILNGFLLPFESILLQNKQIFDELTHDSELKQLECHPSTLKRYFESLEGSDPRKMLWERRIDRLMTENKRAVQLIDHNRGNLITEEFKQACDKFKFHANKWEDVWTSIMKNTPMPPELDSRQVLAPEFPESLWPALKEVIKEVRHRAGLPDE